MVEMLHDIKFELEKESRFFLSEIEYVSQRYNLYLYYKNNPFALVYAKNVGYVPTYYNMELEFRDILHSIKSIIVDAYKALYLVVEYFAYMRTGKQKDYKIVSNGMTVMKKEGVINAKEAKLIGQFAGSRNRIMHDVNFSIQFALINKYQIQNLLTHFLGAINSLINENGMNKNDFEERFVLNNNFFIGELSKCLNDLIIHDSLVS
jgi:uncharacterized protein YutE (UPF0331/DUF86 family)